MTQENSTRGLLALEIGPIESRRLHWLRVGLWALVAFVLVAPTIQAQWETARRDRAREAATKPEDRKAVAQTIEKATDMQAALRAGEEAGKWSLDRCRLYDTMLNRRVECYRSSVNDGSVNKPGLELTHPGYFIEAIPKFARLGVITIALKHASGWQLPGAKDKPGTVETSRESLHLRIKRGAFEMIDIAPANAKDGGLTMVIWLPEKRNAATQPALLDAAVRNVFWWHPYSRD